MIKQHQTMINPVQIKHFTVGTHHPCLVIAEAGVNHNGDIKIAHQLIDEANRVGADAVKFQIFKSERLVTPQSTKADYQLETTQGDASQLSMLKQLELSDDEHAQLKRHCDDVGILYLCTPYEEKSADVLEKIGVDAYKIGATDTVNIPFLRYIAQKKRPVLLSTGMTTLGDVERSVNEMKHHDSDDHLILLQCTSEYPAPFSDINLRAIDTMSRAFGCPVGFSDHTPGIGASPWAVAVGACVIEKHFTLDRQMTGPDHRASIDPKEMQELVSTIRNVELALGDGIKRIMPSEEKNQSKMQKSLVAKRPIHVGQIISAQDLACKRPGSGLSPKWWDRVIGKRAAQNLDKDEFISLQSICWEDQGLNPGKSN